MTELRIYVACLASYNAGILHGRWIDATTNVDEMAAEIADMLKESPVEGAEEWAIHDYEGFPSSTFGEYPGLERVAKWVELIEAADEAGIPPEVAEKVAGNYGLRYLDEALDCITDRFGGSFADLATFAEDYVSQTVDLDKLPALISGNIDFEGIAKDLELGGDVDTYRGYDGNVYVFWAH